MASLACTGCGSPLTLPSDPTAVEAVCAFCGTRTLLPKDLVHLREESFEEKLELEEEKRELEEEKREEVEEAREKAEERAEKKSEERSPSIVMTMIIIGSVLVFAIGTVIELAKTRTRHSPPPPLPPPHGSRAPHPH